jgi:hypothetical protein
MPTKPRPRPLALVKAVAETQAEDLKDASTSLKDQFEELRRAFTSTWMVAERLAKSAGNVVCQAEVREDAASFHRALMIAEADLADLTRST